MTVFTIGYEGKSIEQYRGLLCENGVRIVFDVRRNPFSRKPGFSKPQLTEILAAVGIEYRHLPELGIEAERRRGLNSPSDHDKLLCWYRGEYLPRKTELLQALVEEIKLYGIAALTCYEADPAMCHRSIVSERLSALLPGSAGPHHL